jgi:hypothetical protein
MTMNFNNSLVFNKNNTVRGLMPALSSLCSIITAFYFFGKNPNLILWSCVFGVFLSFYRFGVSKKQQLYYIIVSSIHIFIVMCLAVVITSFENGLSFLFLATLIFVLLCMSRYLHGGKVMGVMAVVYVLLLHGLFAQFNIAEGVDLLEQLSLGLAFALFYTLLFVMVLPEVEVPILPVDKRIDVVKSALRTTILLSAAFLLSYFVSLRNVAWVGFSILVVSEGHLNSTFKKSLERSLGTIAGALVGIIAAQWLFPMNMYLTVALCFTLVFLTYFSISYSYALGIGFATIVVMASFYAFHLHISFDEFALSRVVDTLIGVAIALAGEYFIFPSKHLQEKHS